MISRPDQIAFFASFADFQQKNIIHLPMAEAERYIAETRNIASFQWMEFHPDQQQFLAERFTLINPNKLGICNMGKGFGLATVAIAAISLGEKLVFAGSSMHELSEDDYSNPYLITMIIDNAAVHTNAKAQGGFASMLMDVPDDKLAEQFAKRTNQSLLTNCFDIAIYTSRCGTVMMVLTANRDIAAFSLIGLDYNPSSRLRYPAFKAFSEEGLPLNDEHHHLLQKIATKQLSYRGLSTSHRLLVRFIHAVRKKSQKSLTKFYLENRQRNNLLPEFLEHLTYQELDQLKRLIISCINTITSTEIVECLKSIDTENHLRYLQPRNFDLISCLLLIYQSNLEQIKQRGTDALEYISSDGDLYKDYPNIANNHHQLGKLTEHTHPTIAREHYKISMFYAKHHHDASLVEENQSALDRLYVPDNESYCVVL